MNKKNLILLTTIAFIIFTNLSLLKSSAHKKIHDNNVFFTGINRVSFTVKQHCISPKQPFGTPDGTTQAGSVKHKGMLGINIKAGRHGSGDTVKCISTNMFDSSASFDENFTFTSSHLGKKEHPAKLNFAVKGTLVINGKYFDNIILAQGRDGTRNNWWFGGNQCQHKLPNHSFRGKEQVNCTAVDGTKWCFMRGSTNDAFKRNSPDHVKVETHQCTK